VTCIPAMLDQGGSLLYLARADRLLLAGDRVAGIECLAMDERCVAPTGRRVRVRARHDRVAGGAISSPALLIRSDAPDAHLLLGQRACLHRPSCSRAQFRQLITPFCGAPQSIYSDHFQWRDGVTGPLGYKLEVPPLQPGFSATVLGEPGTPGAGLMEQLPNSNMLLALLRDGFHPDSPSGPVTAGPKDR